MEVQSGGNTLEVMQNAVFLDFLVISKRKGEWCFLYARNM